ncbi:hypothetical protein Moror_15105 [Moniliophthora roreri MCA 2997]|uniref:F-box domain-containing protein n=1 Tax=Moniliophthora roreri (strain MCA 2997) TaxID=1381753 RepID=V2WJ20_MONRO|nr:hypothetical protein Moror_15105 [Moniliophthora roreri MCA 2997]KAI3605433.1 hypothetical protein WG66_005930 [Moniliophthora roreri]
MTLATFDNLPMELVLMILSEIPTIRGRYALLQASNRHRGSAFEIVTLPMITSGAGKHVYILKEPVNRYQLVGPVVLGEARRVNGRLLVDAWRHKNTIEKEFQFGYGSEKYKRKFITMFFPRPTNRYCYELDWDRDCRDNISLLGDWFDSGKADKSCPRCSKRWSRCEICGKTHFGICGYRDFEDSYRVGKSRVCSACGYLEIEQMDFIEFEMKQELAL